MRHRRPAQCGQVDALQRPDRDRGGAGGELSVLHHRAQCRRGGGARSAVARACGAGEIRADRAHAADLRRHRRAGARRLEGRRPGQSVSRQYPRGRCHRARGALLRGPRRHPCRQPHRPERGHRHRRDRTDAGRSTTAWSAASTRWRRKPRGATRTPRRRARRSISSTGRSRCCATASLRAWSSASPRRRRRFTCSAC